MITLPKLFWLLLLAAGGIYWWKAREVKELAHESAKAHCRRMGVEFLDDSVVLRRLKLMRDEQGQLRFWRRYGFEFSSTGAERYGGSIQMLGRRVQLIQLDAHRCPE